MLNIRRLHQEAMMVERKLMISDRSKIKIQRRFLKKKKRSESCENTSRTASSEFWLHQQ
jgi:hypothetical protein